MKKKVIFVAGSSYSGSTLFDMLLSSAEDGFSAGEVCALFYPYRGHHLNPSCGCGNEKCTLWPEVKRNGKGNIYRAIFSRYPEVSYIVDSSKNPLWIKDQASRIVHHDMEVHHLIIWKTPFEFALSRHKRRRLRGWKRAWKNYHQLYVSLINDWNAVKYSDIALNSVSTLKGVCSHVGIEYFEGKEQYWKYKHHTLFGNTRAKIHLYDRDTDSYKNCTSELKQTIDSGDGQGDYRTIYYEAGSHDKLSDAVIKDIQKDKELKLIVELLEANDIAEGNHAKKISDILSEVRYSAHEKIIRTKIHQARSALGMMRLRL
jgi:hypothetical protein